VADGVSDEVRAAEREEVRAAQRDFRQVAWLLTGMAVLIYAGIGYCGLHELQSNVSGVICAVTGVLGCLTAPPVVCAAILSFKTATRLKTQLT
jgi:hypothetical protein